MKFSGLIAYETRTNCKVNVCEWFGCASLRWSACFDIGADMCSTQWPMTF